MSRPTVVKERTEQGQVGISPRLPLSLPVPAAAPAAQVGRAGACAVTRLPSIH